MTTGQRKQRKATAAKLEAEFIASLEEFAATVKAGGLKAVDAKYGIPAPPPVVTPAEVTAAREALGVSERAFAAVLCVTVEQVRAWEAGTETPPDLACRLIGEFRHDPAYWRSRLGLSGPTATVTPPTKGRPRAGAGRR